MWMQQIHWMKKKPVKANTLSDLNALTSMSSKERMVREKSSERNEVTGTANDMQHCKILIQVIQLSLHS